MDTKKLGAALLTGVLAASMLAGCGSDKKDAANDTKKPLRVATNATFVPFEFKDNDQSTEYKGFEMDLIRAVAKEMGRDVDFNHIAFSGIIPNIQQGDMDIAATGMTVTKERAQKVAFAAPFYESKLVILTPKNSGVHSVADLQGKQIAVQIGTTGAKYAEEQGYTIKQFDNNSEAIKKAVMANLGVSVLPRRLVQNEIETGRLVELPLPGIEFKRHFRLVHHKNKYLTQPMQDLISICCHSDEWL